MRLCALRDRVLYRPVLGQRVGVAVLLHELGDLAERGLGDVHRVGPHVGDQADGPRRERHALVQPLGERHRLRAEKPSFRAASCCSVEVVNGGAGDRFRSFWTSRTR